MHERTTTHDHANPSQSERSPEDFVVEKIRRQNCRRRNGGRTARRSSLQNRITLQTSHVIATNITHMKKHNNKYATSKLVQKYNINCMKKAESYYAFQRE